MNIYVYFTCVCFMWFQFVMFSSTACFSAVHFSVLYEALVILLNCDLEMAVVINFFTFFTFMLILGIR